MTEINRTETIPERGILEFTINNIKGEINYIMFQVREAISIEVFSENHDYVVLFASKSIAGRHYLPIRARPIDNKGEGYTHGSFVKYKINDNVKIIVEGREGVEFNFWLDFTSDDE